MKLKSWTPLEVVETILAANLLIWGVIFLFPGNVFNIPRIESDAFFIQDWIWGVFAVAASFLLLGGPRYRQFWVRRYLHIFCWIFWFSITVLWAIRRFDNGVTPNDFLFLSVLSTLAFCHLTLYNRLAGVK